MKNYEKIISSNCVYRFIFMLFIQTDTVTAVHNEPVEKVPDFYKS